MADQLVGNCKREREMDGSQICTVQVAPATPGLAAAPAATGPVQYTEAAGRRVCKAPLTCREKRERKMDGSI